MSVLRLENLNKRFGGKTVLDGIDLEVGAETFCVLLGPSGCGKSTLLNIVAGLEAPSGGRLTLDGRDITGLPPHKRNVAMVFQNYALYPHLTVFENIAFGLRIRKMDRALIDTKVRAVSASLGIADKLARYPRELSGGERQRVATGRAIVRDPAVFLFDEPLSNLDARLRLELRKEFLQLHQRLRRTTLYVTHDQIEALALGDLIVVLKDGRIQQVARPRELYDQPVNLFTAGFIGSPPMNILTLEPCRQDGRLVLKREAFEMPAPPWLAQRLEDSGWPTVSMGIRPSAVTDVSADGHPTGAYHGELVLSELQGARVLAYIRLAGAVEIRALLGRDREHADGDPVQVLLPVDKCYFFSPDGRRIVP